MITRNFYRKIKALSIVFHSLSVEFERIYAKAFIPSIKMMKRQKYVKRFTHKCARNIPCERFGRFYRPTGLDLFKIDELRARRYDALNSPFKFSPHEEWACLSKEEKEWYRRKAEEHFEKMQKKHMEQD
eukprot:jgi/Antlo1/1914/1803